MCLFSVSFGLWFLLFWVLWLNGLTCKWDLEHNLYASQGSRALEFSHRLGMLCLIYTLMCFLLCLIWGLHSGNYEKYRHRGWNTKFTDVSEEHTTFIYRVGELLYDVNIPGHDNFQLLYIPPPPFPSFTKVPVPHHITPNIQSSGWQSFMFGRTWVWISAHRLVDLIEVSHGFSIFPGKC
jgi:hypothetical protein